MSFHINGAGNPGKCTATEGNCPFGEPDDHFSTDSDARVFFENKMRSETIPSPETSANYANETENAEWILNEFPDLEIVDHSVTAEDYGTLELHQMSDPDLARGNCWSTSNSLLELDPAEFGADETDQLIIESEGMGQHVAVRASKEGKEWVVDYTIRQFDKDASFPWVGSTKDWKGLVTARTNADWSWT